ncbi:MAG: molybdopterin molybdotransferase MoeA [Candidatus Ranarchaeia archaeon]
MSDLKKYGFPSTIPMKEALVIIFKALGNKTTESETLPLSESYLRILSSSIKSKVNLPAHDRSAVDGYGIKASDSNSASLLNPRILKVVNEIKIEQTSENIHMRHGEAIKVATGSPIPNSSDAVIMVEDTKRLNDQEIEVIKPIPVGGNISKCGEDVKIEDLVLEKGSILRSLELGLLGAIGYTEIPVFKRPRIGVLACGNELREIGSKLKKGEIFETNRTILSGLITESGGEYIDLGIISDDLELIVKKLKELLPNVDILITTGGTSVGEKDFAIDAAKQLGELLFHGVSIRPGMPLGVTKIGDKILYSLSGVPLAAVTEFLFFCRPIIQKILSLKENWETMQIKGKLNRRIPSPAGIRSFVRVIVYIENKEIKVEPIRTKGANIITSMTNANGFLIIPEQIEGFDEGEEVSILMFKPIEERQNE